MGSLVRIFLALVCLSVAALYVAAPFWAAWTIREAVKTGDVETLRNKVVWHSVRDSLRRSIVRHAQLLPALIEEGRRIRPTLWQRVKSMFGASMLDRFMDRYIAADGLPQLYRLRNAYQTRIQGLPDERLLPTQDRIVALLRRVKRAEFLSMAEVEIEIEDRYNPERRVIGTMKIVGLDWKLTDLVVISAPASTPKAKSERAGFSAFNADDEDDEDEEARQHADDVRQGRLLEQPAFIRNRNDPE